MMKKTLLLPIAILLVCCGRPVSQNALQSDIDSICKKWVPQSSESLCSAELITLADKTLIIKGETNLPEAKSELISYLKEKGVSFKDSLSLLPDATVGENEWGLVTVSVCNMRSDPDHAAEMISQALMGTPVKVLKNEKSWYLVQTPDSYIGWVDDDAVKLMTESKLDEWKKSDRVIFMQKSGDIFNGKDGAIVSDAVFGDILQVTGNGILNYEVIFPDGRRGAVRKSDAVDFAQWAERKDVSADELVKFARNFTGTPYLWAGISVKGIDCSGFARTIYFSGGTIITRDASSQFLYGNEVDITDPLKTLEPGDLLFFGRERDGKKRITHVGMYIGDSEFIHSSGMVKINSLDPERENYSEYLKGILQGAKRFIGVPSQKGALSVRKHSWYF